MAPSGELTVLTGHDRKDAVQHLTHTVLRARADELLALQCAPKSNVASVLANLFDNQTAIPFGEFSSLYVLTKPERFTYTKSYDDATFRDVRFTAGAILVSEHDTVDPVLNRRLLSYTYAAISVDHMAQLDKALTKFLSTL